MTDVLQQLMATIAERRTQPAGRSYTRQLLEGGVPAISHKIREEAEEVMAAAAEEPSDEQRRHLIHETADLTYHLCVLLGYFHLEFQDVEQELARRFGTSGLDEKASRQQPKDPPA